MKHPIFQKQSNSIRLAIALSILTGLITISLVFLIGKTGNQPLFAFATELGGIGNDVFLISTNGLLITWAWRKKVKGVIRLTLAMDAAVWVVVQCIKRLPLGDWALRPSGETGGFPSGHTTHAFAMAFILTSFFPRYGWLWYLCAGVISWSRVESAWHTPVQVTSGVFLGIGFGMVVVNYWLHKYAPNAATLQSAKNA